MADLTAAALEILQQYSRLLNDEKTRQVLAQNKNMAENLLSFLGQQDQKVVRTTLEILLELISCAGNITKSVLQKESNFKETLMKLKEKFKSDVNIVFICNSMLDELFPGHRQATKPDITPASTTNRTRISRFLPATNRQQSKMLIFQSSAFSDTDVKEAVQGSLLKVKGVVSIYFEASSTSKTWRCIIRVWTSVSAQAIADAILSTEHLSIVQQVTKDEYGEEILTDYGNKEQPPQQKIRVPDNKSSPLPEYLDENDDLIFGVVIGDRALTKYGDKESGKGGGWFSGVSSFFSKTLYW